ncbi:hypothetical protein G3I71_33585, partial [Streptomyces sp. SID12501]|nr:hypothetical protein [Streptomyces sp. SID12501]
MSTEARRTSVPPRPATPPPPTGPPVTDGTGGTAENAPDTGRNGAGSDGREPGATSDAASVSGRTPGAPGTAAGPGPSGAPAAHAATPTPNTATDAAPPRFPHLRAPSREAGDPIAPPPPPSSARLPDEPPVGRTSVPPRPRPDLPPRPAHQPPVAPWRPSAVADAELEITRRLRKAPPQ